MVAVRTWILLFSAVVRDKVGDINEIVNVLSPIRDSILVRVPPPVPVDDKLVCMSSLPTLSMTRHVGSYDTVFSVVFT